MVRNLFICGNQSDGCAPLKRQYMSGSRSLLVPVFLIASTLLPQHTIQTAGAFSYTASFLSLESHSCHALSKQGLSTYELAYSPGTDRMKSSLIFESKLRTCQLSSSCLYMSPPIGKSGAQIIESGERFVEITSNPSPSDLPTLLFFTAPWCGPCRLSNPVVKDVMKQFTGKIEVLEVCTDDLPDVAADANVVSIPTIQIYYGGKCMDTIVGCVAKNVLANAVQKVLDDIDER